MIDYDSIIDKYQGIGLPYRDRSDDIRAIVLNLSRHIFYKDFKVVEYLVSQYRRFKYINDIRVEGHNCIVDYDEGIVSFNVFPSYFFHNFCNDVFGFSDTYGQCHAVTQKILESCRIDNISAITSLCVNTNYLLYFHSYILDRKENKVIDFSRRFSMDKDQFDRLFCHKQINDLNYYEYEDMLINSNYSIDSKLFPLLYLSLEKLEHDENFKNEHVKIRKNVKSLR